MKIKNLKSSDNLLMNGLNFKEMNNLKQVVALFGKNGSGKTRLLNTLEAEIIPKIQDLRTLDTHIFDYTEHEKKEGLTEQQNKELDSFKKDRELALQDFECEKDDRIIKILTRNLTIQENTNMYEEEYRQGTLQILTNPSIESIKQNCAKLIKSLCKSEIAKDYQKSNPGKEFYKSHNEIQDLNIKLYRLLKEVIKEIMNKDLDYYVDEHLTPIITLNKRELRIQELSDGEKELLSYCTYLVLQQQDNIKNKTLSLKDKILLLDEPEIFLHPKAQIDLITGLRKLIGENGQIWLATHSLAILSILDRDEIWLMDEGDIVSPSIETPNKVLSSLVGEDNIDSLENFISSQYEWAAIQFALESLFPPAVVPYKENDIQQNQLKDILLESNQPQKILDFGAGKGRIAQEIIRNTSLAENIYYQALEINTEHHNALKKLSLELQKLSSIDNEIEREVLDSHEKLTEKQYDSFFDSVLMINVLHEIPLNKWEPILNAVLKSLKPDGKIIILEDQAIPRGEHAHEYGFLIFDREEFKILFSNKNPPKDYKHKNPKYSDRLSCVEIIKKDSIIDKTSITEALRRKKTNCKNLISTLKNKQHKTAKDGRLNSFLTQLYANVDMALADS